MSATEPLLARRAAEQRPNDTDSRAMRSRRAAYLAEVPERRAKPKPRRAVRHGTSVAPLLVVCGPALIPLGVAVSVGGGNRSIPLTFAHIAIASGGVLGMLTERIRLDSWRRWVLAYVALFAAFLPLSALGAVWGWVSTAMGALGAFHLLSLAPDRLPALRLVLARAGAVMALGTSLSLVAFGHQAQADARGLAQILENGYDLPWGRSNYLAALIILGLAMALVLLQSDALADRWLLIGAGAASIPGLLLTGSRTQLVTLAAALCAVYFLGLGTRPGGWGRIFVPVALAGMLQRASIYIADTFETHKFGSQSSFHTLEVRFEVWRRAIDGILHNPFGHGIRLIKLTDGRSLLVHDNVLQILHSFGIVGFGIVVAIVVPVVRSVVSVARSADARTTRRRYWLELVGLGTIALSGIAENTLLTPVYDMVLFVYLALVLGGARRARSDSGPEIVGARESSGRSPARARRAAEGDARDGRRSRRVPSRAQRSSVADSARRRPALSQRAGSRARGVVAERVRNPASRNEVARPALEGSAARAAADTSTPPDRRGSIHSTRLPRSHEAIGGTEPDSRAPDDSPVDVPPEPSAGRSRRGYLTDSALSFAVGGITSAFGLLSGVIAASRLGPDGRGRIALVQLVVSATVVLGGAGLPDSIIYFTRSHRFDVGALLRRFERIAAATSAAFTLLAVGVNALIWHILGLGWSWPAAMYCVVIIPSVQLMLLGGALRAAGRALLWNLVRVATALCWLLAVAIPPFPSLRAVFLVHVTTMTVAWIGLRRWTAPAIARTATVPRHVVSSALRYGMPSALVGFPVLLNGRVDQVIVAGARSVHDAGVYAAAAGLATGAFLLPQSIALILFPAVASGALDARRHTARLLRWGTPACVAFGLAYGGVAAMVWNPLFSAPFSAGRTPAVILSVAWALSGLNAMLEETLRGIGRSSVPLLSQSVSAVSTVVAALLLVHPFGLNGAAWGSLIGFAAGTVVLAIALTIVRPPTQVSSESPPAAPGPG